MIAFIARSNPSAPNAGKVTKAEVEEMAASPVNFFFGFDVWSGLDEPDKESGRAAMRAALSAIGIEVG